MEAATSAMASACCIRGPAAPLRPGRESEDRNRQRNWK